VKIGELDGVTESFYAITAPQARSPRDQVILENAKGLARAGSGGRGGHPLIGRDGAALLLSPRAGEVGEGRG